MANDIARAVDAAQMGGKERLKGSTATVQFQASQQRADVGNNGFADSMAQFVKSGANAYGTYAADKQKNAQAESDRIIRSMSLQQRREAIASGTLHMQDDPDVMNVLRHDTGRTAAFEVESEIQNKLANGEFDEKDRNELDEYRRTRLEMVAQSYAQEAGIDPNDPDYQRGFNSDIVKRNAGLFDLHDQRRSKRYIAQTVVNTRADTSGLLDDPNYMRGTDAGPQMAAYFNAKSASGAIPTDQSLLDSVNLVINDAVNKDHGSSFLKSFREQTVKVMGVDQKVGDLIGQEKYDNLIAKSSEATYKRNQPKFEKFQLDLASAEQQADPARGWDMINRVEAENNWIQDGDGYTSQKQAVTQAKINMMAKLKAHTQATLKATEEAMQTDNRLQAIDDRYKARMSGSLLGTAKKDMPVDGNTGEFKESDWATYADKKLSQIEAMDIPVEQKDIMRGQLLKNDHEDGPFRRGFQTLIDDANKEWQGAVVLGELGDSPKIDQLARVYAQQPELIAALYPDRAGFIEKMNQMKHVGINPAVLIESEKKTAKLSKEELIQRNIQWDALKSDPKNKDLSAIPDGMDAMARSLYDAFNASTGDPSAASKLLSNWLSKNTVSFGSDDDDEDVQTGYRGMINKKDLMADPNDVNSWEAGKGIVEETVKGIKAASPYWADSPVHITAARNGDIQIGTLTGDVITIKKQSLQLIYQARRQVELDAAKAEKEATFNEDVKDAQRNQGLYKDFIRGGRGPL
uniref:Internal virion protein C n=1 Tax=Pseudomonas phage Lepni01 TaxID=3138536 RepID=A0AAU6W4E4_9VIRU